jgi:hypothetical protein
VRAVNTEATIPALLIAEPQDETLATHVTALLAASGVSVTPSETRDYGARYRIDLERQLQEAKLVVALWTPNSVGAPWALDQADIAARNGRLLNLEAGAKTPLGHDRLSAAPLKVRGAKVVGSRFDFRERVIAATERMQLRAPRRLQPFRPLSFFVDVVSQLLMAMTYQVNVNDHGTTLLLDAAIFLAVAYPAGRFADVLARALWLSLRNYIGRLFARMLGQSLAQIAVLITLVQATASAEMLLSADIAASVFLRTLPYLLIRALRRRLLA